MFTFLQTSCLKEEPLQVDEEINDFAEGNRSLSPTQNEEDKEEIGITRKRLVREYFLKNQKNYCYFKTSYNYLFHVMA